MEDINYLKIINPGRYGFPDVDSGNPVTTLYRQHQLIRESLWVVHIPCDCCPLPCSKYFCQNPSRVFGGGGGVMNHPSSLPGPEINPSLLKVWHFGLFALCTLDINWYSVTQVAAAVWRSRTRALCVLGPCCTTWLSFLGCSVEDVWKSVLNMSHTGPVDIFPEVAAGPWFFMGFIPPHPLTGGCVLSVSRAVAHAHLIRWIRIWRIGRMRRGWNEAVSTPIEMCRAGEQQEWMRNSTGYCFIFTPSTSPMSIFLRAICAISVLYYKNKFRIYGLSSPIDIESSS